MVYVEVPDADTMSNSELVAKALELAKAGVKTAFRLFPADIKYTERECSQLSIPDIEVIDSDIEVRRGGFSETLPPSTSERTCYRVNDLIQAWLGSLVSGFPEKNPELLKRMLMTTALVNISENRSLTPAECEFVESTELMVEQFRQSTAPTVGVKEGGA
jgi:hypothetical protein